MTFKDLEEHEDLLTAAEKRWHGLNDPLPLIFVTPGRPDGSDEDGVTVWEYGTTNSLFFPTGKAGVFANKVRAVSCGISEGEMVQR